MGRKKGRQAGEFCSKSQNAEHRHTQFVARASEADKYRNPLQIADLGRGHGYRNASPRNDNAGYWHSNGSCYGGGDKWSAIFRGPTRTQEASSMDSRSGSINANRATMGLSRLRFLLQERRSEDRVFDRQHRLRLQRSRIDAPCDSRGASTGSNNIQESCTSNPKGDWHDPGWLLSYSMENDSRKVGLEQIDDMTHDISTNPIKCTIKANTIPSLQKLAARALGPLLPMYCASCGNDFVGESLKSVSSAALTEIAISLAMSDWSSDNKSDDTDGTIYATTDGAVKALVHSGVATGLVLRGAPLIPLESSTSTEDDIDEDDMRLLSDDGLLALRPRILPMDNRNGDIAGIPDVKHSYSQDDDDNSSCDHWEYLDFDMDLNSRMTGCFHLKRLELIDIPLQQHVASGGISLQALRTVLRTCSGITHLSLSGCFYNWEDTLSSTLEESNDISMLLCGSLDLASLARPIKLLGKLHGNSSEATHLIPQLLFHQMFQEKIEQNHRISGLDIFLPELKVLDLSQCSWVAPGMLIQFVLKYWEQAFAYTTEANCDSSSNGSQWEEAGEYIGPQGNRTGETKFNNSIQHLNIRGCTGLLPSSSSLPPWMEEWKEHGLFNGIDVSTKRQER